MCLLLPFLYLLSSASCFHVNNHGLHPFNQSPQPYVLPEVVEVLRWRQPICVVTTKALPPCILGQQKVMGQQAGYGPFEANNRFSQYEAHDFHGTKSLIGSRVRRTVRLDELDTTNIDRQSDEIYEKSAKLPMMEKETRKKRHYPGKISYGKEHFGVNSSPIYVTKILNSPVVANLVVSNCFPDIGIPLCNNQDHVQVYDYPSYPVNVDVHYADHKEPFADKKSFIIQFIHDFLNKKSSLSDGFVKLLSEAAENFKSKIKFQTAFNVPAHSSVDSFTDQGIHFSTPIHQDEVQIDFIETKPVVEHNVEFPIIHDVPHKTHSIVQATINKKDNVLQVISDASDKKKNVIQDTLDKKKGVIQGIINKKENIAQFITDAAAKKKQIIHNVIEKKKEAVKDIIANVAAAKGHVVQAIINKKLKTVQDIIDKKGSIVEAAGNVANAKYHLIRDIVGKKQGVIQGIIDKKGSVVGAVAGTVAGTVAGAVAGAVAAAKDHIGIIDKNKVVQGIINKKDNIVAAVGSAALVKDHILQGIHNKKHNVIQGIVNKKDSVVQAVSNAAVVKGHVVQGIINKKQHVAQDIINKKGSVAHAAASVAATKDHIVRGIIGKKHDVAENIFKKKEIVADAISNAAAAKDLIIQNIAEKKENVVHGIIDKKQNIIHVIENKKANFIEDLSNKRDNVVHTITSAIDKKQNLVTDIVDKKDHVVESIVDKTQNLVQALVDKKANVEFDTSSNNRIIVQDIADSEQPNIIHGTVNKKQFVHEQIAKEANVINDFSGKNQLPIERLVTQSAEKSNDAIAHEESTPNTEFLNKFSEKQQHLNYFKEHNENSPVTVKAPNRSDIVKVPENSNFYEVLETVYDIPTEEKNSTLTDSENSSSNVIKSKSAFKPNLESERSKADVIDLVPDAPEQDGIQYKGVGEISAVNPELTETMDTSRHAPELLTSDESSNESLEKSGSNLNDSGAASREYEAIKDDDSLYMDASGDKYEEEVTTTATSGGDSSLK